MSTVKNWEDWLKAWEELRIQAEVTIEQADSVIPLIKATIEKKRGEEPQE